MSKEPIIVKNSDKAPIKSKDCRELSSPTQKHKLKRRHNLTIAIWKILKFYGRAPIFIKNPNEQDLTFINILILNKERI